MAFNKRNEKRAQEKAEDELDTAADSAAIEMELEENPELAQPSAGSSSSPNGQPRPQKTMKSFNSGRPKCIYVKYFDNEKVAAGKRSAACKLCPSSKRITAPTSCYSNFERHYEIVHDKGFKKYQALDQLRQPSLQQSTLMDCRVNPETVKVTKFGSSNPKQLLFNSRLALFISDSLLPPFSMGKDSFKSVIECIDPHIQVPNRKVMTEKLSPKMRAHVESEMQKVLDSAMGITILVDLWFSRDVRGYMGVIAQFVASSWQRRSFLLGCPCMKGSYTADSIRAKVEAICDKFNITKQVLYVGVDNAANMLKAFRGMVPGFEEAPDEFKEVFAKVMTDDAESLGDVDSLVAGNDEDLGDILDQEPDVMEGLCSEILQALQKNINSEHCRKILVKCNAHLLQLCLGGAIISSDRLRALISRMAKLVKTVMKSASIMERFEETGQRKLVRRCKTRWNSNCRLLKRIVETDWKVVNLPTIGPSSTDLEVTGKLVVFLDGFEEVFQVLQDEMTPAVCHILPLVIGLLSQIRPWSKEIATGSASGILLPFLAEVHKQITERLKVLENDSLYIWAVSLHPRYKLDWIMAYPPEEQPGMRKEILSFLLDLMQQTDVDSVPQASAQSLPVACKPEFRYGSPSVLAYLKPVQQTVNTIRTTTCHEELQKYFESQAIEMNPLAFWTAKTILG